MEKVIKREKIKTKRLSTVHLFTDKEQKRVEIEVEEEEVSSPQISPRGYDVSQHIGSSVKRKLKEIQSARIYVVVLCTGAFYSLCMFDFDIWILPKKADFVILSGYVFSFLFLYRFCFVSLVVD